MPGRWEGDERGRGVASARSEIPAVDRLRTAIAEPDWVAEAPKAHLLPHVETVCSQRGWHITRADVVGGILDVEVLVPGGSRRALREVAFAVVGSFAELSTHAVEVETDDRALLELVVTTGILEDDGAFAPHGHVVRLAVRAA